MLAGIYAFGAWLGQATAPVTINPTKTNIPGSKEVESVVSGMAGWGLVLSLAAMIIAGVIWAFGAQSQNHHQATQGKRGVLIAAGCAALMTAAPAFINWAQGLGSTVK